MVNPENLIQLPSPKGRMAFLRVNIATDNMDESLYPEKLHAHSSNHLEYFPSSVVNPQKEPATS